MRECRRIRTEVERVSAFTVPGSDNNHCPTGISWSIILRRRYLWERERWDLTVTPRHKPALQRPRFQQTSEMKKCVSAATRYRLPNRAFNIAYDTYQWAWSCSVSTVTSKDDRHIHKCLRSTKSQWTFYQADIVYQSASFIWTRNDEISIASPLT